MIEYAKLGQDESVFEVGLGTGQATKPILKTGCMYTAIELGDNFTEFMKTKFGEYENFNIICDDFETHDFDFEQFDLVYSAAAFQWIPEKIGYSKAYDMLKPSGAFAMFMVRPDIRPGGGYTDEPLYSNIQKVYSEYFRPEQEYTCKLDYDARGNYGFVDLECRYYHKTRTYTADEYVSMISTHSDHLTLIEPNKTKFYAGIRKVILDAGNSITLYDKITMYLAKKPLN